MPLHTPNHCLQTCSIPTLSLSFCDTPGRPVSYRPCSPFSPEGDLPAGPFPHSPGRPALSPPAHLPRLPHRCNPPLAALPWARAQVACSLLPRLCFFSSGSFRVRWGTKYQQEKGDVFVGLSITFIASAKAAVLWLTLGCL